ncbi:hypothetical protein F183_A33800 [Bryobacterales bacterium F-183]|nr:hypothetical protein F183_A33800 [Bryobacterales bacterium F-183]
MIALALMLTMSADFEYIRAGNAQDVVTKTQPGYALLGGGGDVTPAFEYLIRKSGGGDFLVLRATGSDAYNPYVQKIGGANSAATLILKTREASSDPAVLDKVRKAEAIFFAGGDQWNYVSRWKDTPLHKAIQERIDAGVPVGGTSAGLAILGEYLFSAEFDTVQTPEALADPFFKKVTVATGFLKIPNLRGLITDSHFMARKRMGRLLVFLARMPVKNPRGLGIDEATAVLLEPDGKASVVGKGSAWFFRATRKPQVVEAGKPLEMSGVDVYQIDAKGAFDLKSWKGTGGVAQKAAAANGELQLR